jgi:hypothetical protein
VIAHSQGGIVARYLDYQWSLCENGFGCKPSLGNRNYYGVVTFATPNAGAHIGLSKHEHYDMVNKIVNTIVLKPLNEGVYNIIEKWLVSDDLAKKINLARANIDTFLKKNMAPALLAGLHSPTLDSMVPNTPIINNLTTYPSRLRRVAFYGVEDAPEVWRIMDMVMNDEPSDVPLFTANTDEKFIETVERIRKDNLLEININQNKIKISKINRVPVYLLGGLVIGGINHYISHNNVKKLELINQSRQETVDFLNNANTEWRYLIGSYHRDSFDVITDNFYEVHYLITKITFSNLQNANAFMAHLANEGINSTLQVKVKTIPTRSFFPSDGVVLVKSQKAFPGVKDSDTDIMEGNNHFQVRNSSETRRVLLRLYEEERYDQFFRLTRD